VGEGHQGGPLHREDEGSSGQVQAGLPLTGDPGGHLAKVEPFLHINFMSEVMRTRLHLRVM
jgi:hypothetical protein